MFLHLGSDIAIKTKTIIAIMDLETSSVSKITKEFLKKIKKENIINVKEDELPKSYVITEENGENKVYISPISSRTLNKRAESKIMFDI